MIVTGIEPVVVVDGSVVVVVASVVVVVGSRQRKLLRLSQKMRRMTNFKRFCVCLIANETLDLYTPTVSVS